MKYRDSETGEFKELYTKAADTLPVGTVVDYDGDEVPAGWEEVEETPIIESGSNANGSYIKFADGTMICRKTFSIGELAPNAITTAGWLFPVAPINIDYQVIGQLRTGGNNWDYLRSILTYVDLRGVTINVKNMGSLIADASTWDFIAIGKWK